MKINLENLNYKKIAIIFAVAFAYGIIFGFLIIPNVIKMMIKMQVKLKPGNEARDIFNETPFPLHFYIYVFNITNPEEYINGGKAKLKEVGPYYFDEWKDKFDQEENIEEDTITFNMRNTWIFRPDKSNGLTGNEIVNVPHPLVQLISLVVYNTRPPMIELVAKGLKVLFPNDFSAVYTGRVMDIFFDGIPINCGHEEFSAKAICTAFHGGEIKNALKYNDTTFLFSYMAYLNHSSSGRFTVCRGVKNIHKLGKVIRFNDEEQFEVWHEDECNKFHGTDSTVFPPFMTPEDGLWAVTPEVCRSLGAVYRGKSKYAGLPASRYTLDLGDLKNEPEHHCFCGENSPDDCPVKGTMNLAPCLDDAPLIASMPHFLNGDESLFENVEGLEPQDEKHLNIIDFERISGTPFKAAKRLQYNLDQKPIQEVEPMKNLRKMVLPLFWVEEGVAINKTYVNMVRPIFIGKAFNNITKWLSIIMGSIGFAGAMFMHTQQKSGSIKVTPTKPVESLKNNNSTPNKKSMTPVLGELTNMNENSISNGNILKNNGNTINGHKLNGTERF